MVTWPCRVVQRAQACGASQEGACPRLTPFSWCVQRPEATVGTAHNLQSTATRNSTMETLYRHVSPQDFLLYKPQLVTRRVPNGLFPYTVFHLVVYLAVPFHLVVRLTPYMYAVQEGVRQGLLGRAGLRPLAVRQAQVARRRGGDDGRRDLPPQGQGACRRAMLSMAAKGAH
jgi:hypothetical protein